MKLVLWILFACCVILCPGCGDKRADSPSVKAVYYWRATFRLSEKEMEFIDRNDVGRLYVKFFDVVADGGKLRPEATLVFADRFPAGVDVVPVVFIDSRALRNAEVPPRFPSMILGRVDAMMVKNGYEPARELQVDFDWTEGNRGAYFGILSELADSLHAHGRKLSVTVRLHQLSQPAPPADYGSLMLYNTGNFADPSEPNSILSMRNVKPYLPYLGAYRLPLATALPVYSWDLLFRSGRFMVIAHGVDCADTALFAPVGHNRFAARRYRPLHSVAGTLDDGVRLLPGDIVRHEQVSPALLDSVVDAVASVRPEALDAIILYHLDENSLDKYSDHEIKKLYRNH